MTVLSFQWAFLCMESLFWAEFCFPKIDPTNAMSSETLQTQTGMKTHWHTALSNTTQVPDYKQPLFQLPHSLRDQLHVDIVIRGFNKNKKTCHASKLVLQWILYLPHQQVSAVVNFVCSCKHPIAAITWVFHTQKFHVPIYLTWYIPSFDNHVKFLCVLMISNMFC